MNSDTRVRVLVTIAAVAVVMVGNELVLPGTMVSDMARQYGLRPVPRLFSIGIHPYLSAAFFLLLLSGVIYRLGMMREGSDAERASFDRSIVWLALIVGLFQATGAFVALSYRDPLTGHVPDAGPSWVVIPGAVAGTALLIAIAQIVSRHGVGNGVAWVAFASLCSPAFPEGIRRGWMLRNEWGIGFEMILIAVLGVTGLIAFCRFYLTSRQDVTLTPMEGGGFKGPRPPVTLPVRVNLVGVVPSVIAQYLLALPSTLAGLLGNPPRWIYPHSPAYWILFAMLTIALSYVITGISFDTRRVGPVLRRFGYAIEGAQDQSSEEFLDRLIERRMVPSAIALIGITVIPAIMESMFGVSLRIVGITGGIILVGCAVVLDTIRHARTLRSIEAPAPDAGAPEDSDTEPRLDETGGEPAVGAEERGVEGQPQPEAWVEAFEADTELEARLALATLESAGIRGVMLSNRVIPFCGTLALWEWTVPTYPFLVIHRRLGGGRLVVRVPEEASDRAREVLAGIEAQAIEV